MIFARVFFVVVLAGAFFALGYAFWLTFQPLDAPPRESSVPTEGDRSSPPIFTATQPEVPDTAAPEARHPAHMESAVAAEQAHPEPLALDRLREPMRTARQATETARQVRSEVRRASREISEALPPAEDITLENAWRAAKVAGAGLVDAMEEEGTNAPRGAGRIHPAGAPAHSGGGQPGGANQPGIDWYKAGGRRE